MKRRRNLKRRLILALTVLSFGGLCRAQTLVPVTEELPNDQFIVTRNGKEYRALNADKIRDLLKQKVDLDALQKINSEQNIQIKELALQRDLAEAQKALIQQRSDSFEADFKRAQEDAKRNFGLYISERELRIEAAQFIPHGNKTKFDKFLSVFDSKAVQFAIKGFIPIWTAGRCQ